MKSLQDILKKKSTKKLNLKLLKRNTFDKAKINGVSGNFILDTKIAVGFESIELFLLTAEASKTKASGAGATECYTNCIISYNLEFERFIIRFSDF
jgi:hypothetical protein